MMKSAAVIFITLSTVLKVSGQDIPIPENYVVVDSVSGDLDNDKMNELVVAYDTKKEEKAYEDIPRELIIYKIQDRKWVEWKQSEQALLNSRGGGVMGDPYAGIEIKNGILLITHSGGSSWKWGYTDKYRFQENEFYLIGYSRIDGRSCDYHIQVDYNLSTGKLITEKVYEACEGSEQENDKGEKETFYKKGLKITLQNRQEKEIKIISPKYKHEICL